MIIKKNTLSELRYYLSSFQTCIESLPLEKQLYNEGTTVGQLAFHAFQAVNYWFRVILMEKSYVRNRDEEFTNKPTLAAIKTSLASAIEACTLLEAESIHVDYKLKKTFTVSSGNFVMETAYDVILHMTTHTAEHWGELHLLQS